MRRTKVDATDLMTRWAIPNGRDFHTLGSAAVELIIGAADEWGYRKPKNANGSRARCFYEYLTRLTARAE